MSSLPLLIVTGGSRGIGAAISRLAAARGYRVLFSYVSDAAAATALVAEIKRQGGQAEALRSDIAREADILALFAAADGIGNLAGLVNNAGITGGLSRLADVSAATLQAVFSTNITGSFLAAREAVRRLSTRQGGPGGGIVNVSSRAGALGGSGEWIHYAASKGAIDTFTIGLAREVGGEGIRVNAVAPGLIETELHAASGAPDRLDKLVAGVPMQRTATAEEVAEAVLWLLSPAASYVNGAIVPVSGGR